jgi:hypothetical protein
MRTIRLALSMLLLLLVPLPAPAGDVDEHAGHEPFLFVIDARVEPPVAATWTTAVRRTAEAHAGHARGNVWAAYRSLTGGPDAEFRFVFPLRKLGDLDGWQSNRQILVEAFGNDLGKRVAKELDLDAESSDRILALSEQLSRPAPGDVPAAPRHVWAARVTIEKGKMTEYAAVMRRVLKAYEKSEGGPYWLAYASAIGGADNEILYLVPFERFAELDDWPLDGEALAEAYGETEAARLGEALSGIARSRSRIWRLAPGLSNLPAEE